MDSIVYEDVKLGPFLIADVDGMVKNNIKDYSHASNLKLAEVSTSSYQFISRDQPGTWVEDEIPYFTVRGLKYRKAIPITAINTQESYRLTSICCDVKQISLQYMDYATRGIVEYYAALDRKTKLKQTYTVTQYS